MSWMARDAGIEIGYLPPGPHNTITDVPGVLVGHTTLISGDGPLFVGTGPIRTGVTVIRPHRESMLDEPLFASYHVLNGNGEVSGLGWMRESGLLTSPLALTNSHSVGTVRDTLAKIEASRRRSRGDEWMLPVVGETWDGILNDINGQHVRAEHVRAAFEAAGDGSVEEGNVGGGTGMICHEFKGGIGTSSRTDLTENGYTLGVLLQANHGRRERLQIGGRPVGQVLTRERVPSPTRPDGQRGGGSIIVVIATDAPLLPHQCRRLAQRAGLGIARTGGTGEHGSGDLFLAFSVAHDGVPGDYNGVDAPTTSRLTMLHNQRLDILFDAVIEATEEAIINALLSARTMVGRDGNTAHGLSGDTLQSALREHE